jgi:hypothetical protein
LFPMFFSVFLWFSHIFPMIFPHVFHDYPTFFLWFSHIFPTTEWDDAPGMISPSHLGAKFQAPNLPRDADWQTVTLDKGLSMRQRCGSKWMIWPSKVGISPSKVEI